jgi:hypothetical protein
MSNDSVPRPFGHGPDSIGGRDLVLPDEASLAAMFGAAGKLKEAGWALSSPMSSLDISGRVLILVIFGSKPVPDSRGELNVAIRSWDWDAKNPHFELITHGPDVAVGRLVFGPWSGARTSLEENGGIPTPQQAIRMLGAQGAARIVRGKTRPRRGRHH